MSRRKKPAPETWPKVVDTIGDPTWMFRDAERGAFAQPSVCNGEVRAVRYRITVEPIDEPEAVAERIRSLWRKSRNPHDWAPLRDAAKQHGVTLDDAEQGVDGAIERAS